MNHKLRVIQKVNCMTAITKPLSLPTLSIRSLSTKTTFPIKDTFLSSTRATSFAISRNLIQRSSLSLNSLMFFSSSTPVYKEHPKKLIIDTPGVPPLRVKWFFATNNPIKYPEEYGPISDLTSDSGSKNPEKTKFNAFQDEDSVRLEGVYQNFLKSKNTDKSQIKDNESKDEFKVEVNEDHLFEVDLETMQMMPIYWSGAIYQVRRGTWFNAVDSTPLSHELSEELEKGFIKIKPFEEKNNNSVIDASAATVNPLKKIELMASDSSTLYKFDKKLDEGNNVVFDNTKFGYVFNSENVTGGLQLANVFKNLEINSPGFDFIRVVRGFNKDLKTEILKKYNDKEKSGETTKESDFTASLFENELTRLLGSTFFGKSEKEEDAATKAAMELEITEDYNNDTKSSNTRKIKHLVLCIHGIGQVLGPKYEAANFIHTVNILRKNVKSVYAGSEYEDSEKDASGTDNSGIQVLPIVWRHKVDFKQDSHSLERLPSLSQITVDEIKPMRNLIGAVLLDILLYYEPYYLKQILEEVTEQANFMVKEFKRRNPDFEGKVSIIGHSLGSVIGFDLLSSQYDPKDPELIPKNKENDVLQFDFNVENYFAIGSPIGVFNLLRRRGISGRDDSNIRGDKTMEKLTSMPKCGNFYNIFHPCDPVGYKLEPLVSPSLSYLKPASLELDTIFDDFNKTLNTFSEKFSTLKLNYPLEVAETATNLTKMVTDKTGDVVNIFKGTLNEDREQFSQLETKDAAKKEDIKKDKVYKLSDEQLKRLTSLNYKGRIDYAFDQGFLDISVISSLSAHVSYFENENTAAFVLKELLKKERPIATQVKVSTVNDKPEE